MAGYRLQWNGTSLAWGPMRFVLDPSSPHLYFISHVSQCNNSCGLFSPSADNYFSLFGFVIICFLLASLSIDIIPQILDRCSGVGSGDTQRGGLLLHYLVLLKQTNTLRSARHEHQPPPPGSAESACFFFLCAFFLTPARAGQPITFHVDLTENIVASLASTRPI